MSVNKFSKDNNVYFVFTIDKCLVKSHVANVVLLEGHVGSDDLYEFPPISLSPIAKSSPLPTSLPVKVVPRAYSTSVDSNLPNV